MREARQKYIRPKAETLASSPRAAAVPRVLATGLAVSFVAIGLFVATIGFSIGWMPTSSMMFAGVEVPGAARARRRTLQIGATGTWGAIRAPRPNLKSRNRKAHRSRFIAQYYFLAS